MNIKIKKTKTIEALTLCLMTLTLISCGYSDYSGHPAHKTQDKAYIPIGDTVVTGYGEYLDGSYVWTVEYDNRAWQNEDFQPSVKLVSYRNPVINSFPYRPGLSPDADDFEGTTGFSGGTFTKYWTAVDTDPTTLGDLENFDKSFPLDVDGNWIEPLLVVSIDEPTQEVDNFDWDLQSSTANIGNILKSLIKNGGNVNNLEFFINALEFNGKKFSVEKYRLGYSASTLGMGRLTIKNQHSSKEIIQTILKNTQHLKAVDLKIHFDNGMTIDMPKNLSVMFNHQALSKFTK